MSAATLPQFRPAWRKRIVHGALIEAGKWFIGHALMRRFTDWSRSALGYRGPDGYDSKDLLRWARGTGLIARIAAQYFHGWDPWSADPVPRPLLEAWSQRVNGVGLAGYRSRSGNFGLLKQGLRRHVKASIRSEVIARADDRDLAKLPFVATGDMRAAAPRARAVARTTRAGVATLRVVLPRTHAMRPQFARQFTTFTGDELRSMAAVVRRSIGASLRTGMVRGATPGLVPDAPTQSRLRELIASSRRPSTTTTP